MQTVNLYMLCSIKGPKIQTGKYGYVLECIRESKDPATLTKTAMISGNEKSCNVDILLETLKRLNKPCNLHIYTECNYIASALGNWINQWQQNEWKSKKGEEIAYKDQWQQIFEKLKEHKYQVYLQEDHEYKLWLKSEINKMG